jgi:RNA binding exosome subunit
MVFLYVKLRAFCQATEDSAKVRSAIDFLLPTGTLTERKTEGHHGNPILVLESKTEKRTEARQFWERLMNSAVGDELLDSLDSRIDEQCVLHARLDKQKAYLGEMGFVNQEDVITVYSKIESYPRKRETAVKNAEDFLGRPG